DMQELDDKGEPIKDKAYEDISVNIGQGRFDPDLEEQIIGLKSGDEKKIEKVYPDDFPQKEYAGKKEAYLIKIKSVQREELPELNDDFVKEMDDEPETVDELKKSMYERLEHEYKHESENRMNQELMQKLVEENPFDMPAALVENYLDNIVASVKRQDPKAKEDIIRQYYQNDAEFNIKVHYIKEKIAEKEKIKVNDDDIKTFLDELKDEKVREFYEKNPQMLERVKEDILQKKIDDFLFKNTKVKTNKVKL
ncbi:MAG: hypothetical protein P8X42_08075, partial [Calditrichaceae bacterium]